MSVNKFGGKQLYVKNIELYVKNIELYVKNIENNCMSRQIWWKTIVCQDKFGEKQLYVKNIETGCLVRLCEFQVQFEGKWLDEQRRLKVACWTNEKRL